MLVKILSPEDKVKPLMTLIDNMAACARDNSSQSFQLFLEYRGEILNVLQAHAKEQRAHLDLLHKLYRERLEIDEKIFKSTGVDY